MPSDVFISNGILPNGRSVGGMGVRFHALFRQISACDAKEGNEFMAMTRLNRFIEANRGK